MVIAEQLFADVPGGTGRYTEELLHALVATAPSGWTVSSVVCRHADVSRAVVDGVRGPRVLPLPRRALVALWQAGVRYWPGGSGVGAVHAPTPFAPPGKPRGRSATLTVTVHDTVPWTHPETLTPRGVRWHRTAIARAMRTADAVVVPTRAVADDLAARVPGPSAIRVIPHGVAGVFKTTDDVDVVFKTTDTPRVASEVPEIPDSYVLAVGTIEPRKGIDVLIAAVGALHRRGEPAPTVLLAGQPGWGGLNPLELAAAEALPAGTVRLLGRLPDAELAAVLRGASVLVVPSRAEGFGLPVLEAMAAGVPVIHSDVPALVEVAGGAGVVVPRGDAAALADALRGVLADRAEADRLTAAGKLRAAEFSWARAAESLWKLHLRP